MKARDCSIDFLAGILLFQIIYNHCCAICKVDSVDLSFLAFYMPWFFYKGGMFFKGKFTRAILQSGVKRLIIPFIRYSILGLVIDLVLSILRNESIIDFLLAQMKCFILSGSFFGNLPLWFLLALFCARIISNFVVNHKINIFYIFILLYIISILLNFIQENVTPYIPYIICTVCTGTLFFILGYLLKNSQYNKYIFLLAGVIYLTFLFGGIPIVDMRTNFVVNGQYFLWLPFAICGCIFFNNLVRYLPASFIESKINVFTYLGVNSMTFYVWHWILLLPTCYLLNNIIGLPKDFSFICTFMIILISLFFVSKKNM